MGGSTPIFPLVLVDELDRLPPSFKDVPALRPVSVAGILDACLSADPLPRLRNLGDYGLSSLPFSINRSIRLEAGCAIAFEGNLYRMPPHPVREYHLPRTFAHRSRSLTLPTLLVDRGTPLLHETASYITHRAMKGVGHSHRQDPCAVVGDTRTPRSAVILQLGARMFAKTRTSANLWSPPSCRGGHTLQCQHLRHRSTQEVTALCRHVFALCILICMLFIDSVILKLLLL